MNLDGGEVLVYPFNIFLKLYSVEPTHFSDFFFFHPLQAEGCFLTGTEKQVLMMTKICIFPKELASCL